MKENKLVKTFLIFVFLAFLSFHFFILQVSLDLFLTSILGTSPDALLAIYYFVALPIFLFVFYRGYYPLRWMEEKFAAEVNPFVKTFFAFMVPIFVYLIYKDEFRVETTGLVIFISLAVRWGMEQIFLKHTKK